MPKLKIYRDSSNLTSSKSKSLMSINLCTYNAQVYCFFAVEKQEKFFLFLHRYN